MIAFRYYTADKRIFQIIENVISYTDDEIVGDETVRGFDKASTALVVVDTATKVVGDILDDATILPIIQARKKAELSAAVSAKIVAGYQSTAVLASTGKTYLYGTTLEDQQNMTASRVWSDNNPTATVKYRPSGGVGRIDHSRSEFVTISDTVFNRVNWYLDQVDVYTPQIYAAGATAEQVNAIVITIADPS